MIYLQSIVSTLQKIMSYQSRINRFSSLNRNFNRIAHFGCSTGYETLALSVLLGAHEVIGVDINEKSLQQARDEIKNIHEDLKIVGRNQQYFQNLPDGIRLQVENFIRDYSSRNFVEYVEYIEGDITQRTSLQSDYFDLVFSDNSLYWVACSDNDTTWENTINAIREMSRVAKPTGIIVANEPKRCFDGKPLNLRSLFEQNKLLPVEISEDIDLAENEAFYIFKRA
ncbi:MAG: class I SAM-dependent methyltransferase [Chloroflexi bacterium]|nr:class I SAM-dependent methyltransferase [Chloroflexota bacterium]